jgi:XRCC1 N terminal domain
MRKRLIASTTPEAIGPRSEGWLDVERIAVVEVTSEEKGYPVESALTSADARGWRAATPGSQTIRLVFDEPQRLKHISLVFEENETARTQEFVLRWSPDGGNSVREIVRQQWNFSPPESMREVEEYQVDLFGVTVIELVIKPNIGGGLTRASLRNLRLA